MSAQSDLESLLDQGVSAGDAVAGNTGAEEHNEYTVVGCELQLRGYDDSTLVYEPNNPRTLTERVVSMR